MTTEEWQEKYSKFYAVANRIADRRTERCRQLAEEAGLDPTMFGLHANNAMCSYHYGKPWAGVDYAKVRQLLFLESHIFDGYHLLSKWSQRVRR